MNSVVEDIKDILEAENALGLVLGTNLFLYREPAMPNEIVTLFETPGMQPIGLLSSDTDTKHYERPSMQIRVRYKTAETALAMAYAVEKVLNVVANETWGDYYYALIYSMTNPFMTDWDEENRIRIILNFNIQRRLT